MAPRAVDHRPKSVTDLQLWLGQEVAGTLREDTELIAHGGTALTLLGLKDSTKDVDISFRTKEDFDRVVTTLERLGYERTADLRPTPRETQFRYENPSSPVDVVDIRYPTWNNWRLTKKVLEEARAIPHGRVRLVLLDRDAIFLFKTYPLRDTDLDDLRTIIERSLPNAARVIQLFDEQDRLHRAELGREDIEYEPLFHIVNLRVRYAASLHLIGKAYAARIPRIDDHAQLRFRQLKLRQHLPELLKVLRDPASVPNWDGILGKDIERLRQRLSAGTG